MDISKKIKETIDELNPAQKKKAIKCIKTAEKTEPVGRPPNPRERLLYKETIKKVKGPRGRGTVETAKDLLERRIEYYEDELGYSLTDSEIRRIFSVELKRIADKEAVFLGPKYQSRIGKMEPGWEKTDVVGVSGNEFLERTTTKNPNPSIQEYKQRAKKIMKEREERERDDMDYEDERTEELRAKAKAKAKVKAKEDEAKEQKTMGEEDKLSKEAEKERKRLKKAENERLRALKAARAEKKAAKATTQGSGYPNKQEIKSLRQNLVLQLIRPTNRMVEHSNMNTREF